MRAGWFAAAAEDIDGSGVLRRYAAALGVLHALTGVAWFTYKNVAALVTGEDAVCWPLAPGCEALREHLTPWLIRRIVAAYIGLGAGAALLFLWRRPHAALGTFLAATALGIGIYALDYRMRFNPTYMFGCVVVAFLVSPRRRESVSALVVAFYFWAGILKLNREWLSGAALYARPLFVPEALVPASCAYVLVLELVMVWGLLSSRAWVRWAVLAQLALFHVASVSVVGWFYPLTMFGLLSLLFPVSEEHARTAVTFSSLASNASGARRSVLVTAGVFSALQLVPWLHRGDPALTGEGRLFALHMFDARVSCEGGAELDVAGQPPMPVVLLPPGESIRMRCDPLVIAANVRRTCREPWARAPGARLDVAVDAKRTTDASMRPLVRIADACHNLPTYTVLGENPWIVAR
ncbi:MAG TPA: hypothetical protein VM204_02180 [Gaiellaceae bacterium]|nr:hypothetical protein [Gaiellaceae bacterium]